MSEYAPVTLSPAHAVPGEHRIRVVFNGAPATYMPLIARMVIEENIEANILFASTKGIGEKAYGSMLLGIPGDEDQLRRAMEYLQKVPDVLVREVSDDV